MHSENQIVPGQMSSAFEIEGRRIIDINYFLKQILDGNTHEPFGCSIANMEIIGEKRHGLHSDFILKCKMCAVTKTISSEYLEDTSTINVNSAAVLASISTGIGYSNLEEMHAALNIPPMSYRLYSAKHNLLAPTIHQSAWDSMEEAGKEEARMARELGEVDESGTPLITVIADGAWCKRSYRTKYDANSGVGCIVGARSHKLLFLGIRNKYCTICSRAEAKKIKKTQHVCYKNWQGTSTSMESDIIVDGFRRSRELHGVIYHKLVGDGDSSVTKKLLQTKPYGNRAIQKIECTNHLLRNFCNKLRELSTRRVSNSLHLNVPPILRQNLKSSIMRLRVSIVKSVEFRKMENIDDVDNLRKDIINTPNHVFGDHENCAAYFCKGRKEGEKKFSAGHASLRFISRYYVEHVSFGT